MLTRPWSRSMLPLLLLGMILLLVPTAHAFVRTGSDTTTWHNSVVPGEATFYPDDNGEQLDAHSPHILTVTSGGGSFDAGYYMYGDALDCGWAWAGASASQRPYCGVNIYYSVDLKHWTKLGPAFSISSASTVFGSKTMTQMCAKGCFRPKVIYNPSTRKYVLWINVADSSMSHSGFAVFTSDSPAGPFMPATDPQLIDPGAINGDENLYVDPAGTAWIVYTRIESGTGDHWPIVEKLDAAYTNKDTAKPFHSALKLMADQNTFPPSGVESPTLFSQMVLDYVNGVPVVRPMYYLMFGPTCPYCNATSTYITSAFSLTGTWGPLRQVNSNSCFGQADDVLPLGDSRSINDAGWLYLSDQWKGGNPADHSVVGAQSQALSTVYIGKMTADTQSRDINSITCSSTVQVQTPEVQDQPLPSGWQGTSADHGFTAQCAVNRTSPLLQIFAPSRAGTLDNVWVSAFQRYSGTDASAVPDSYLRVSVMKQTPNGLVRLAFRAFDPSQVAWAPSWLKLSNLGISIPQSDVGRPLYAIELETSTTRGCYGVAVSNTSDTPDQPDSYNLGGLEQGDRTASKWTALSRQDLDFRSDL